MAEPTSPTPAPADEDGGFLAPAPDSHPVDHCVRCGKETPAGTALCDEHNPHHLSAPSSTQMHATIFGGIVIGVIGFFLLLRLLVSTTGPYVAEVTASTAGAAGGVVVSFVVANEGESEGVADCRVTRDGVPRPDDLAFRTARVPAGETLSIEKELPRPAAGSTAYVPDKVSVICS